MPASVPRWALPLAAVAILVALTAVDPGVFGVVLVLSVVAALIWISLRASQVGLATRDSYNRLLGYRAQTRTPGTRSMSAQDLSERAAQLEKAAERFRLAGDEKMAASFAAEAVELRRRGA
jgi:hypothetical protein